MFKQANIHNFDLQKIGVKITYVAQTDRRQTNDERRIFVDLVQIFEYHNFIF